MQRTPYRPDAKPDGPITPAFGEIPDAPVEPAKRTRRPKGPLDEIDQHIAAIQTARHEVRRCHDRVEQIHKRLVSAVEDERTAQAKLNRLTAGLIPPPEIETSAKEPQP